MLITQRPVLTEDVIEPTRSRFVIEPLEPGFGYTLGNSLRRTLLSSIPGAAVTTIRINGAGGQALHEFSTLPGVKEDVTDIILNVKELVVSSDHDEPVTMFLRKQGAPTHTHTHTLSHSKSVTVEPSGQLSSAIIDGSV